MCVGVLVDGEMAQMSGCNGVIEALNTAVMVYLRDVAEWNQLQFEV